MRCLTAIIVLVVLQSSLFLDRRIQAETEAAESRILGALRFLASDDLKGRAVGTQEIDHAAEYIASQFESIGLQTDWFDGLPFQSFPVSGIVSASDVEENQLHLIQEGGQPLALKLGSQFQPLAIGASKAFDLPIVFVGYGITNKNANYDDYAEVDARDKAVIILRKEPQEFDKDSVFDGDKSSKHALFTTKVSNAVKQGAKAVVFVNSRHEVSQQLDGLKKSWKAHLDELNALTKDSDLKLQAATGFDDHRTQVANLATQLLSLNAQISNADRILLVEGAGRRSSSEEVPVIFCQRVVFAAAIQKALGKSLAEVERQIDIDLKPRSIELSGCSIKGVTKLRRDRTMTKNVLGILPGHGPLAKETVIIGAHYDHLGLGGPGSLARWTNDVHNGADDNASGVVAMLEVARRLAALPQQPKRRVVFIAFSGEERGLLGSKHYVRHPRFPLEETVAMLNLDMVGRLSENDLQIHGVRTATEFETIIDRFAAKYEIKVSKTPGGNGPSDHASFNSKKIPVLHFFTGLHKDYHRPSDDVAKVDVPGIDRIANLFTDVTIEIAQAEKRFAYQRVRRSPRQRPPFVGIRVASAQEGLLVEQVVAGGPAEQAGMHPGDMLVRISGSPIQNRGQLTSQLSQLKPGNEAEVTIMREKVQQTFKVKLGDPR